MTLIYCLFICFILGCLIAYKKDINKNIEMAYDHGYYDGRVLQIERKDILYDSLQSKKSL